MLYITQSWQGNNIDEFPPPLRALQLILGGFIIFLALFAYLIFLLPQQFFSVPRVVVDNVSPADPPIMVTRSFPYQNGTGIPTVSLDPAVCAASKKTFRSTFLFRQPEGGRRPVLPGYDQ